jgi:hypothetical protein
LWGWGCGSHGRAPSKHDVLNLNPSTTTNKKQDLRSSLFSTYVLLIWSLLFSASVQGIVLYGWKIRILQVFALLPSWFNQAASLPLVVQAICILELSIKK